MVFFRKSHKLIFASQWCAKRGSSFRTPLTDAGARRNLVTQLSKRKARRPAHTDTTDAARTSTTQSRAHATTDARRSMRHRYSTFKSRTESTRAHGAHGAHTAHYSLQLTLYLVRGHAATATLSHWDRSRTFTTPTRNERLDDQRALRIISLGFAQNTRGPRGGLRVGSLGRIVASRTTLGTICTHRRRPLARIRIQHRW